MVGPASWVEADQPAALWPNPALPLQKPPLRTRQEGTSSNRGAERLGGEPKEWRAEISANREPPPTPTPGDPPAARRAPGKGEGGETAQGGRLGCPSAAGAAPGRLARWQRVHAQGDPGGAAGQVPGGPHTDVTDTCDLSEVKWILVLFFHWPLHFLLLLQPMPLLRPAHRKSCAVELQHFSPGLHTSRRSTLVSCYANIVHVTRVAHRGGGGRW